jgi:hypothetical protein
MQKQKELHAVLLIQRVLRGCMGRQKAKEEKEYANIQKKFKRQRGSPLKGSKPESVSELSQEQTDKVSQVSRSE